MVTYLQTWMYASRIRRKHPRLLQTIQGICAVVTGHTPSKTEWGYGGGDTVDSWCRWCNAFLHIPASEALTLFPDMVGRLDELGQLGEEAYDDD